MNKEDIKIWNVMAGMSGDENNIEVWEDMVTFLFDLKQRGDKDVVKKLAPAIYNEMPQRMARYAMADKFDMAEKAKETWWRACLLASDLLFDAYLRTIDFNKPYDKKFYLPRARYLKRYVDAYQEILDGKLDFLSISMPKRTGKSTLGINFTNMLSGLHPDKSTLMEGTGDDLVKSFYNGCLEYIQLPTEYQYYDIFPNISLKQTNADTKIINLMDRSRFPTVMCRSIDARQVGLSEATNLLYLDDCVEGREEAKNRQRLDDKWEVISGDILGRALPGVPIIICGTRYSIYDPIGRLQDVMTKNHKRMKILETPALDFKTDESNFWFIKEGKKLFDTDYFREQREMLTAEQWESEFQQQPFEAKGLLFPPTDLNYYYDLPEGTEPDAIVAVCDTAEKGEDYTVMLIGYIYDTECYVVDVVCDDAPPIHTKAECAEMLIKHKVQNVMFESNNAGEYYAKDVRDLLNGYPCAVRTKRSTGNKATRIEFASDNIIKHFWFKHTSLLRLSDQYSVFMKMLVTYTRTGKNPHDDAPDACALLENELRRVFARGSIEPVKRPF